MSQVKLLLPLFLLFMTLACKKNELTLPAKLNFKFELISHEEEDDLKVFNPGGPPFGKLEIDRGTLTIGSIEFEGRRDEGRDIFFESNFPGPLSVILETGEANRELSFDIPQGIYNRVDFYFELGGDDEISLVFEGRLKKGQTESLPLRFEYNIRERIKVRAEPVNQGNKIVLRKDSPSTASIIVDAGAIFQFVNLPALQNAGVSIRNGEEMIIISSGNNSSLFNAMANRIERSFRVIID